MKPRRFEETEREARARAEVDPATRERITYAHEHAAAIVGGDAAELRRVGRAGGKMRASDAASVLRSANLTIGEALAAGLVRP